MRNSMTIAAFAAAFLTLVCEAKAAPSQADCLVQGITMIGKVAASCSGSGAFASANLATGILRDSVSPPAFGTGVGANSELWDVLTFSGFKNSDPVFVSLTMTLHGSYGAGTEGGRATLDSNLSIDSPSFGGIADGSVAIDTNSSPQVQAFTQGDGTVTLLSTESDDIKAVIIDYASVSETNPTIDIGAQLIGSAGSGAWIDFSKTASLGLFLPDGLSYTSQSGVFLSQSTVPEPAEWTLMLLGIGCTGVAIRSSGRNRVSHLLSK